MPEVIIPGPDGRLEARYMPSELPNAPVALFMHPHPLHGGTMNNKVVYNLYHGLVKEGFACLRFNFRGVGHSQGTFAQGEGELSDAAAALNWLQQMHDENAQIWVVGFSFGAWIGMQLLMRRPEIQAFISIAPPANMYDFNFLAPCPSSGLIVQGLQDEIVDPEEVDRLVHKLHQQKGITVTHKTIPNAGHFFVNEMEELQTIACDYVRSRKDEWPDIKEEDNKILPAYDDDDDDV